MPSEMERVYMHVVTKGGEAYARDLGVHDRFSGTAYLTRALENGGLIKVDDDLWLSMDVLASVRFRREEVH